MPEPRKNIDTLRVLVDWKCNLSCSYCCNEIPEIRAGVRAASLDSVEWDKYDVFCISGGEPTLFMNRVKAVCDRIPAGREIYFYTNGTMLSREYVKQLCEWGVGGINVGLHMPQTFKAIIRSVLINTGESDIAVRFHVQDIYKDHQAVAEMETDVGFRFWKMDDCERENEDRVVLQEADHA